MKPSTERLLELVSIIAKEKITYNYDGKEIVFTPPKFVYVSQNFFRTYKCQMCGWCCLNVTLDYYENNVEKYKELYPEQAASLQEVEVIINGTRRKIWVEDQSKSQIKKCRHLIDNKLCSIHKANPWSCGWELAKMRRVGDRGFLTLQKPARGWINRQGTTSSCVLDSFSSEHFRENVKKLEELNIIIESFQIKTWIPEILEFLYTITENNVPKDKTPIGVNLDLDKEEERENISDDQWRNGQYNRTVSCSEELRS